MRGWGCVIRCLFLLGALACVEPGATGDMAPRVVAPAPPPERVRFAVIGDYGQAGPPAEAVARLVRSWNPDFIVTTGDNNYPRGEARTMDANIGRYYHMFIAPYRGRYGPGADRNRFFPALGNHDWATAGARAYFDYFSLPGNERYYDVRWGPVHLFVLDSDPHEPDGITASSRQAHWLEAQLQTTDAPWRLVILHHPPYSSGLHGPTPALQWPFAAWGVTAVLAGHDHVYERIERDGILYFVNGLGGHPARYPFRTPIPGSRVRYREQYGAMRVEADACRIVFQFIAIDGRLIDTATRMHPACPPRGAARVLP
ncbi:Alkaline phosphatase [Candidatus Thermoflexus japonica]|uniref:Alkaline phosphatase n=1 Tax=Candidatus Thermoflexus japonica TaxID=2035417 RepID=A0A2H5Y956_9CHLR|nr:Alkaline phosphatase [Candidatus Thermoflexus japonica]